MNLSVKTAVIGMALTPFVVGGITLYQKYLKPDPIEELYCYCVTSSNEIQWAKLDFWRADAQKVAKKLLDGHYDNTASNRVDPGDIVVVYKYYGDPPVAKVEWTRKNYRNKDYTESGWVPKMCLHKNPLIR